MNIDWDEVHKRIEAAETAIERLGVPSAQERRAILAERARELARASPTEGAAGECVHAVTFALASELYAVEYAFVRDIHPLKDFTPIPGVPSFVLGIVNLRGEILSIIDFRGLFELPARGLGELNKVIILRNQRMEFGILADEVLGVRVIPRAEIRAPIATLTGIGAEYLIGITDDGMIVLDAKRILGDERIIVDQGEDR
jgi:purine-binding chemotaxis protein CheW